MWADPSDPVALTVITTAYARANILTQIRWLRLLTGNADPPGTNYTIISNSVSSSAWGKVTTDVMAAGAALANLADNSVNGDAKLIDGSVRGDAADSSISVLSITGNRLVGDTMDPTQTLRAFSANSFLAATIAKLFGAGSFDATNVDAIIGDNTINGDDKLVAGSVRGDAAGSAISTDSVHANRVKASTFDETQVDRVFSLGAIDSDHLKNASITNAQMAAGAAAANVGTGGVSAAMLAAGAAASNVGAAGVTTAMHADSSVTEPKLDISNSATDGYLLAWNNGAGKFSWTPPPSGTTGVPSGLIAFFQTAAALAAASGWAAYTPAQGRLIVGAGTAFTVTFVENTSYGSSWSHVHAGNTWTGTGSTTASSTGAGVTGTSTTGTGTTGTGTTGTGTTGTGTSGQPTGVNGLATAGGVNLPETTHTHSVPGLSVPGLAVPGLSVPGLSIPGLSVPALNIPSLSATVSVSGDTAATQVIPPIHALLAAQKS